MQLLALDTSNQAMSVAVMQDSTVIAETTINHRKTHSDLLMPTIQQLLAAAEWQAGDLDRVVVAAGPGSYTGIRIAVTTGKMLAYTLGIELAAVSSLAVLAAGVTHTHAIIVPLMDARRQNVFAGGYQWRDGELLPVIADRHLAVSQLLAELALLKQPVVFTGVDTPKFAAACRLQLGGQASFADPVTSLPRAARLGLLGLHAPLADAMTLTPQYLRVTEAERQWLATHDDTEHEPYVEKV